MWQFLIGLVVPFVVYGLFMFISNRNSKKKTDYKEKKLCKDCEKETNHIVRRDYTMCTECGTFYFR